MKIFSRRRRATVSHHGCERHPAEPAIGACERCNNNVCDVCRVLVLDRDFCVDCAMVLAGVRVKRR